MFNKKIVLFIFIFLLILKHNAFAASFGIQEKIILENTISKRIEEVAGKMLGEKNIIAYVNVEHNASVTKEIGDVKYRNFLPGIPIDNPGPEDIKSYTETVKPEDFIKQISVTLMVNDKVDVNRLGALKEYVSGLINLKPERGDKLEIKKTPFAMQKWETPIIMNSTIVSQLPLYLGLILISIFLFGTFRAFLNKFVSAMDIMKFQIDTRVLNRASLGFKRRNDNFFRDWNELNIPQRRLLPEKKNTELSVNEEKHFSFVNDSNIKKFILALKNENPDIISIALLFLPRQYSMSVLNSIGDELRNKTLKNLVFKRQYDKQYVSEIENTLKQKLEYLLGGAHSIVELINVYEEDERDKIISDLSEDNYELVLEIKQLLVTVDDLSKLSREQIFNIYHSAGARVFAAAVKSSNDKVKEYVLSNLEKNQRAILQQEMDLIPADIPNSRVIDAKKNIISMIAKV